jgi:hypothetical protein
MGEAKVLETAAETPPIKKSRKKVPMSFFFPLFYDILLKFIIKFLKFEHLLYKKKTAQIFLNFFTSI